MRVELAGRFAPGKRLEGLGGNEGLGLRRENRRHLVPRLDEQPRELGRLVGRDSACSAEENAGHAGILPARRSKTAIVTLKRGKWKYYGSIHESTMCGFFTVK